VSAERVSRVATRLRRLGAGALALLGTVPLVRVLERPEAGLAGAATADQSAAYASFLWAGTAALIALGLVVALAVPVERIEGMLLRAGQRLARVPAVRFAVVLALFAFAGAAVFSHAVLGAQPNLIDAMSQLVHARFIAAGQLSGPGAEHGAFWHMQQALFTEHGWVSQYPPGHAILLAAGIRLGAVWAVGPLMLACTAFFATLIAQRLFPERPALARLGAVFAALSPFLLAHAGAYMSHASAAAFATMAIWFALRAHDAPWSAAAMGAAAGALFTVRPLTGLAVGAVAAAALLTSSQPGNRRNAVIALAAAAPFLLGIALWNVHFFGSPFRFGYDVALGPSGGLGFGVDPWGNAYGPMQAVAYLSAELSALSLFLLETPLPLVLLIALALASAPRLSRGERILGAWALVPLAASIGYWHHGLFMGPRMLADVAPAWSLLAAWAGVTLVSRTPRAVGAVRISPRGVLAAAFAAALICAPALAAVRLGSYGAGTPALAVEAARAPAGSLVFVHGGWPSRIAMRLAAHGMSLDSVETALRRNDTCRVHAYTEARIAGGQRARLDFERRAGRAAVLQRVALSPGNEVNVEAGATIEPRCRNEAWSDRFGVIEVAPILWTGDLPGFEHGRAMFVRDLGPAANVRLIAAHPGRVPMMLHLSTPDGAPRLAPYEEAMRALWTAAEAMP
jgi:hypothetical protein